jgi:hypothetical protein
MSGFSADWLALREPADLAARSVRAARTLASKLRTDREVGIVDLGAGTGANLRFLMSHLRARQRWTLVDRDPALLARLPERVKSWAAAHGYEITSDQGVLLARGAQLECRISTREMDLAADGAEALEEGCAVVTASALLDLVSQDWLDRLVVACARRRSCALFALTYDGRIDCGPPDAEDERIRDLVNLHQRTDKGFGPALGPEATTAARACFTRAGYEVQVEASDWVLEDEHAELQRQLIRGWADAAREIARDHAPAIEHWRDRRLGHVDAGRSRIIVGHTDLVASPLTPTLSPVPGERE